MTPADYEIYARFDWHPTRMPRHCRMHLRAVSALSDVLFGGRFTMCLAVPTRIKYIDGEMADVELDGVSRMVSLAMVPDAQAGNYVLVHAGYAIALVDEDEARETLKLFREMEALQRQEVGQTE